MAKKVTAKKDDGTVEVVLIHEVRYEGKKGDTLRVSRDRANRWVGRGIAAYKDAKPALETEGDGGGAAAGSEIKV